MALCVFLVCLTAVLIALIAAAVSIRWIDSRRPPPVASILLALALLAPVAAHAQCGGRGCAIAQPSAATPSSWEYVQGWRDAGDGSLDFYWRGEKCGRLDPVTGRWTAAGKAESIDLARTSAVSRGEPKPGCVCKDRCTCKNCPADCAVGAAQDGTDPFPGGVDLARIPQGLTYECSGKRCSQQDCYAKLDATLEDDRAKPFLTAVLDDAGRKQLLQDLETHPALAPWRGKLHVNAYAPGHWQAQAVGLAPGVSYQAPPVDGKSRVQFRFETYPGAEALANALRQPDPSYRPDKDPDPTKKPPADPTRPAAGSPISPNVLGGCGLVGLAAIAAGLLYLARRR